VPETLLQPGDLIFRMGRGHESRIVRLLDSRSDYSHVGLIDKAGSAVYVIHAVPDGEGLTGTVRRDTLADFAAPESALAVAVFRVDERWREVALDAVRRARSYLEKHLPFDSAFDLETADALYCTELVWRAYEESGLDLVGDRLVRPRIPWLAGLVILPSGLRASPVLQRVFSKGDPAQ
jgi:hypothetical protein